MWQRWARRMFVTATVLAATASSAQAGHFNSLGRKLGLGWSDGYHAHDHGQVYYGWAPTHSVPQMHAPPPARRPEEIRPAREAARPAGPVLPSQLQSPRPAYWYR